MDKCDPGSAAMATDIHAVFQRPYLIDLDLGTRLLGLAGFRFAVLVLVLILFVEGKHADVRVVAAGKQLAGRANATAACCRALGTAFAQQPSRKLLGKMHLAHPRRATEQQAVGKRIDPFQQALPDRNVPIMYFINRYLQFLSQVIC